MQPRQVRSSIARNEFNSSMSALVALEFVAVAFVVGVYFGPMAGFVAFLALLAVGMWRSGAAFLVVAFAVVWAVLGAALGNLLGEWPFGLLGLIVGFGFGGAVNHGGLQYFRDIGAEEHQEL